MNLRPLQSRTRYASIIESFIARAVPFTPATESNDTLQVERAADWRDARPTEVLNELGLASRAVSIRVVDRAGHERPLYRPMLAYGWLMSNEVAPRASVDLWCDGFERSTDVFGKLSAPVLAADGALAAVTAWRALVLTAAGIRLQRSAWREAGRAVFRRVCASRRADGSLLHQTASDNPETQWYHELVLAHALTSYAALTGDHAALDVALANADFHQEQTQPDHATSQPWMLAAFILNPNTGPLADQVLHAMETQHPRGTEGVSLLLLNDALYCLRNVR